MDTKFDFSEAVIHGLSCLAISDSLLPFHSLTGGRKDCAADDKTVKKKNAKMVTIFIISNLRPFLKFKQNALPLCLGIQVL